MRREALRGKPYDAQEVDALLQLGQGIPSRKGNGQGLIEIYRIFMKAKPKS